MAKGANEGGDEGNGKVKTECGVVDVIIVGAGIAGMTAAIYAKRAGKSVLLLEAKMQGGQMLQTLKIANWPGEVGVSGVDLAQKIYHQVNNLGIDVNYEEVVSVRQGEDYISVNDAADAMRRKWCVKTDEAEYSCGAIIIATGTVDKKLGLAREEELTSRGVSYCATCDGAFYKDKAVAVIGGGNTALYDALYLADICERVYVVHRRDKFRGDAILVERLSARQNVEMVMESVPTEIIGEKRVEGLMVKGPKGERQLVVSGVFVAIGRVPATGAFDGVVSLDENGYVVAEEDCRTSAPGVFVAGDCRAKKVHQLVTAAADGAVAAGAAVGYLA